MQVVRAPMRPAAYVPNVAVAEARSPEYEMFTCTKCPRNYHARKYFTGQELSKKV